MDSGEKLKTNDKEPQKSGLPLDPYKLRGDFPILQTTVRGKPLVFLDSAASSQKPQVVIDAISEFYKRSYANIHRGVYKLSALSTAAYENARVAVQRFINAADSREIVFVRNATEGINLVANSFGSSTMRKGDEVVITQMEHHANIVPWQMLRDRIGLNLKIAPMSQRGELLLEKFEKLLGQKTRMVAVTHVSNSLGTINPVREIIAIAHSKGIPVLVDGAQATPHMPVDVRDLDCDFYVFSSHKIYGPTGIGVLYGKLERLKKMPPYQGGGDMIKSVTFEKTIFADAPQRFEAGTPDIAGAVGLATAIEYLDNIGMENIHKYGTILLEYGTAALQQLDGLRLIGTAENKSPILSFVLDGVHPHDIGTILDSQGICVRTGHHCAQPVMDFYNLPATTRASMTFYNTIEDIDRLVDGLRKVIRVIR